MFAVDHVLVSDAVLRAPFVCHLGACKGACCVIGADGAPLADDERDDLVAAYAEVEADLLPESRAAVEEDGLWYDTPDGAAVQTVEGEACVFVIYEGDVAVCAIQKAYQQDRLDWPKPLSCHLYPIRVEEVGGNHLLNYETSDLCEPAVPHGRRLGVMLPDFLREPLTRAYGADWYQSFRQAAHDRANSLYGPADTPLA